jgi:hypothetical protein
MKRLGRATVVVATVAITGGGLLASPASAAQVTVSHWGAQGAYDNNPGNRSESWAWVYVGRNRAAYLHYRFYDGTGGTLSADGQWSSKTANLGKDIRKVQLCVLRNTYDYAPTCSPWK